MALTAVSVYTPPQDTTVVLFTALIFVPIGFPTCSIWIFIGKQIRRWLDNPIKMRAFNISMAVLLLTSLYPIVFAAA